MAKGAPSKPALVKSPEKSSSGHGGARPNTGGACPNAGRTSKAAMMGLLALLDECWTETDRRECVKTLSKLAKQGDMDATKLLFNYAFGRPKEVKELTGADGGAIRVVVAYEDRPIDDKG